MSRYEDLKILDELREKGSITEEEYQREKEIIFNRDHSSFRKPLFGMEENTYLMIMHLSQLFGLMAPLAGFIIPFLLWMTNKDANPYVNMQGKEIMNFILSYLLYGSILGLTIVGLPFVLLVVVAYFIFVVRAALMANKGKFVSYPLTIQFIR